MSMSSREPDRQKVLEKSGRQFLDSIREVDDRQFSDQFVQDLLTRAVKLYAAEDREDTALPAVDPEKVTVTEIARTVGPMLDAVKLELFELTMWRGLRAP